MWDCALLGVDAGDGRTSDRSGSRVGLGLVRYCHLCLQVLFVREMAKEVPRRGSLNPTLGQVFMLVLNVGFVRHFFNLKA